MSLPLCAAYCKVANLAGCKRPEGEAPSCPCLDAEPEKGAMMRRALLLVRGKPKLPSLPRQAANLAGAAVRTIARVAKGQPVLASPETLEARLATCAACPRWVAESRRCSLCGCRTDAKLRLAGESCPDSPPRWGAATTTEPTP